MKEVKDLEGFNLIERAIGRRSWGCVKRLRSVIPDIRESMLTSEISEKLRQIDDYDW